VYLSKFLATSGAYSRRKATEAIKSGVVIVNDKVVTEPFYMVKPNDEVCIDGQRIRQSKKFIYILLNKPENYITTVSDEHERRTVLDLVRVKTSLRLYPVGRLDRMTTGLLLLTNDGELTKQLTHPSHEVVKKYCVELDSIFQKKDLSCLAHGITLVDGFIKPDDVYYSPTGRGKKVIIELHSGRNRIVRRIFEYLGYNIIKLDRFFYAGLTTKGLAVGKCRHLSINEIEQLKSK
jgi:23S rRNA pseudouridine2605 synthase